MDFWETIDTQRPVETSAMARTCLNAWKNSGVMLYNLPEHVLGMHLYVARCAHAFNSPHNYNSNKYSLFTINLINYTIYLPKEVMS